MNALKPIRKHLIVGASTLFATLPSCAYDCDEINAEDTNDVQEGEDTLVGAECNPYTHTTECDLNNSNTVYCDPSTAVWRDEVPNFNNPKICVDGELIRPRDCTTIGYAGITNQNHRNPTHLHTIRTQRTS